MDDFLNPKNSNNNCVFPKLFTSSRRLGLCPWSVSTRAMAHPALCGVARRAGAVRGRSALGIAHISALLSCRPNTHSPNLKASYSTQSDPASLSSEMVTYARRAWRGGDRSTACGVLEHGADLITRAVAGQQGPVAVAAHAAKARTHLAWATMQSVRPRKSKIYLMFARVRRPWVSIVPRINACIPINTNK